MIILQVRTNSTAIIPTRIKDSIHWQVLKDYIFTATEPHTTQDIPIPDKIENFYNLPVGHYRLDIASTIKPVRTDISVNTNPPY